MLRVFDGTKENFSIHSRMDRGHRYERPLVMPGCMHWLRSIVAADILCTRPHTLKSWSVKCAVALWPLLQVAVEAIKGNPIPGMSVGIVSREGDIIHRYGAW